MDSGTGDLLHAPQVDRNHHDTEALQLREDLGGSVISDWVHTTWQSYVESDG